MAKKISKNQIIKIIVAILVVIVVGVLIFLTAGRQTGAISKGNNKQYNAETLQKNDDSVMQGDSYVFLGSDFTFGAKSGGQSFVDYLKAVDGIKVKKYGGEDYKLNGKDENTLVYTFNKAVKKSVNPKVVFCEVPVCNASGRQKNGELTNSYYIGDYDTTTLYGAMEYICARAELNWGCKVVFITCPSNDEKKYAEVVNAANAVAEKWGTKVINFYNNDEISFDKKEKRLYLVDDSSPTKAGYNSVYGPKVEEFIQRYFYL